MEVLEALEREGGSVVFGLCPREDPSVIVVRHSSGSSGFSWKIKFERKEEKLREAEGKKKGREGGEGKGKATTRISKTVTMT